MTDSSVDPELAALLSQSLDLLEALEATLEDAQNEDSIRGDLVTATSALAIEHGASLCMLVEAGNLTSANVLLRTQYEAVTRAIWMCFIADADWYRTYTAEAHATPAKQPKSFPSMDSMLKAVNHAHPHIGGQLVALQQAAWGLLNSFVHTGIYPTILKQTGYPLDGALATVRNANALTTMAFAALAALSREEDRMKQLSALQLEFRGCLPPLDPSAASPPTATSHVPHAGTTL